MELSQEIQTAARYWATSPVFDSATRGEVSQLIDAEDATELVERFYKELEFGTGGMRGIMGAGTSRMNIYNIRKATTALALEIKECFPSGKNKVAISYDSRHRSQEFAQAAAEVLAAHGIQSLITKQMRPTPMLSFMVRHYSCQAGICVTASHNPPAYNGYKVYWQTGGQLVPPHDSSIVNRYLALTDYENLNYTPYAQAISSGDIIELLDELDAAYFEKLQTLSLNPIKDPDFQVTYSPIHGTGIFSVPRALEEFGVKKIHIVEEQADPNGDFPTVKSPNPEDPAALKMALDLGRSTQSDIILATDPDTDRIALVVKNGNELKNYNGNQLGSLLNHYVLSSLKDKGQLPENGLVIKTIVTTDLQQDIADSFGIQCDETLTGFKWICDQIEKYENGSLSPRRAFICGGEESYGFLAGSFVRDKDAVIGCALAAEMVAFYKSQGKSLDTVLDELFSQHSVYQETLKTYTLPGKSGAEKIQQMMNHMRQDPPLTLGGKAVKTLSDYQAGSHLHFENGAKTSQSPINLPRSNVLQFVLEDGSKASVRPSGTEPKIKLYISVKEESNGAQGSQLQAIKDKALNRATELENEFSKFFES